ncbi:MAG: response regulator transcription factor [Pseudomonadota bacterium]
MKPKEDISIIVADDHPMILKGLCSELKAHNYHVIGQATNGLQALEIILASTPTLAFLDIDMPFLTGFEVIKMAKKKHSATHFIVLSYHKEVSMIQQAQVLGIQGYLLKEDSFSEIDRCIKSVLQGDSYFSSSIAPQTLTGSEDAQKKLRRLTPSEKTVLKQIAEQMTTKQIAEQLFVSTRTIEKHRSHIISKLELDNTPNALTIWALKNQDTIGES